MWKNDNAIFEEGTEARRLRKDHHCLTYRGAGGKNQSTLSA